MVDNVDEDDLLRQCKNLDIIMRMNVEVTFMYLNDLSNLITYKNILKGKRDSKNCYNRS